MRTTNTKWYPIYEQIKKEIEEKKYKKYRFTIEELCKKFRVSEIVGRRVIAELVKEKFVEVKPRVGVIIKKVLPSDKIYFLIPEQWEMYGESVSPLASPILSIFFSIISGIEDESHNYGLKVEHIREYSLKQMNNKIILSIYNFYSSLKWCEIFSLNFSHSYILLHSVKLDSIHTVRHDIYKSSYIATKHLIDCGCKRIAYIGYTQDVFSIPRIHGYIKAIREAGLVLKQEYIKNPEDIRETGAIIREKDFETMEYLLNLPEPPDGIFCVSDVRAINIMEYCYKRGIKIPDDISICGYDNIPESERTTPPLTTVDVNRKKIGREGVKLAIRMMEGDVSEPQDIIIKPELVIRESTKIRKGVRNEK